MWEMTHVQEVWIPVPNTGWTFGQFFTLICCKKCIDVCLKRLKINEKEARVGPFSKIKEEFSSLLKGIKAFDKKYPIEEKCRLQLLMKETSEITPKPIYSYLYGSQLGAVWPDLAKFSHFVKILKVLGQFLEGQLNICQIFGHIWAHFYVIG